MVHRCALSVAIALTLLISAACGAKPSPGVETGSKPAPVANTSGQTSEKKFEDFEPKKYEDRYRAALMELIDAKLEGQPIKKEKHRVAQGEVVDLLEALKNSVSTVKSGGKKALSKAETQEAGQTAEENVVPLKRGEKKATNRKSTAKSAARAHKASGIGRISKTGTKAKKTSKAGAKSKSKKRSA